MGMYEGDLRNQIVSPKKSTVARRSVLYSNHTNINDGFLTGFEAPQQIQKVALNSGVAIIKPLSHLRRNVAYFAFALSIAMALGVTFLFQRTQRLTIDNDSGKLLQSLRDSLQKEIQNDGEHFAEITLPDPEPAKAEAVLSYKVKSSEGVDTILTKIGVNKEEKSKALSALSFLGNLKLGANIEVLKEKTGEILSLRFNRADSSSVSLNKTELGGFQAVLKESGSVKKSQRVYSAMITGSFNEAVKRAGVPSYIVNDFVDLFDKRVDFQKDLEKGDSFAVLLEETDKELQKSSKSKSTNKYNSSEPKILAATITAEGKPYYAVRHVGADSKVSYVDEKGRGEEKGLLKYPVQFTRISSVFSNSRFHPVLKRGRPHNGVDFAAPYGTIVRTVGDGLVVEARYHPENGNFVRIKHNDRYTTEYLHLSKIGPGIRQGARVTQGQVIGNVGSTGLSTGAHLHFGMFDSGRYINPMNNQVLTVIAQNKKDVVPQKYINNVIAMLKDAQESAIDIRQKQLALISNSDGLVADIKG